MNTQVDDFDFYYVANPLGDNRAVAVFWCAFETHQRDCLTFYIRSSIAKRCPGRLALHVRAKNRSERVHVTAAGCFAAWFGITKLPDMAIADSRIVKCFGKKAF